MTDSGEFDARPVRAFLPGPDVRVDESVWPASVPAQVARPAAGERWPSGALAEAYGLNPQGGRRGRSFRQADEPGSAS